MDFLEKDLELILYETPSKTIQERGLRIFQYNNIERQVHLGNYGIADLVTFHRAKRGVNFITVYELKNKILNAASFWQIIRYIKGIKHFLYKSDLNEDSFIVKGVLIGREIDTTGEFSYLPTINSDVIIYTYDYHVDGIKFSHMNDSYSLVNPGNFDISSFGCETNYQFLKKLINGPDTIC